MRWPGIVALCALLACGPAAAQSAAPVDGSAASSESEAFHDLLTTCFSCHGPGGVSVIPSHPTIAGQNAPYIARQLTFFKHAARGDVDADANAKAYDVMPSLQARLPRRSDPVMEHMAQDLSAAVIERLAVWISNLPCDAGRGEQRSTKPPKPAIAARCDSCHGADGVSRQPHIPNLAGQQEAYLRRQLLLIRETAFGAQPRAGERWRTHPIMERQAGRLSIADVDALAAYYSALDCRGTR